MDLYQKVWAVVRKSKRSLVISHQGCLDGGGALLAWDLFLKNQYLVHDCYWKLDNSLFSKELGSAVWLENVPLDLARYDLLIVLDCSDPEVTGLRSVVKYFQTKSLLGVLNIDHHSTNSFYGQFNLVDLDFAATSQLLFSFWRSLGLSISSSMATALLIGILGDTDCLVNAATSAEVLLVVAQLLELGADYQLALRLLGRVEGRLNFNLSLWSRVWSRLCVVAQGRIAYTYLLETDLVDCGVKEADLNRVANWLNQLQGVRASFLVRQLPAGRIKVSIRTSQDNFDLGKIAVACGGGGHQKAAGFIVPGQLSFSDDNKLIII